MLQMTSLSKQAKDRGNRGQIMEPLDLIAQNGMLDDPILDNHFEKPVVTSPLSPALISPQRRKTLTHPSRRWVTGGASCGKYSVARGRSSSVTGVSTAQV